VQFHPEVTHTKQGNAILKRFVLDICGTRQDWVMGDYISEAVEKIRQQVGDEEVILGLSGGVDSSVAAALIHRAIGDQLTCVFRRSRPAAPQRRRHGDGHVRRQTACQRHSRGCQRPVPRPSGRRERARSQAQDHWPRVRRSVQGRGRPAQGRYGGHKGAKWLAQGTIYPDVIESGGAKSKKAVTIKSHHNVGGLPEQLGLKLLEPLRELFKDEVRELGVALGLPHDMVYRHPFPGPGLGVRILGEVKKEYADLLRRADAIFIEELRNFKDAATGKTWYDLTSQAFTVFLPVKSVGVMGDGRTYDYVVALRAVQTSDFMTADWAELPYALLKKVSGRIINEVRGINRVTYDVSSKPPATIEWE
jgi:GMP synthase (glutamine-hydrolysing)